MPKRTDEKFELASKLIKVFWPERFFFLGVNVISIIILVTCAITAILKGNADTATLIGLFGPTGIITFNTGRILKMWTDTLDFISKRID